MDPDAGVIAASTSDSLPGKTACAVEQWFRWENCRARLTLALRYAFDFDAENFGGMLNRIRRVLSRYHGAASSWWVHGEVDARNPRHRYLPLFSHNRSLSVKQNPADQLPC